MGKARSSADANDFIKASLNQNTKNFGLQRADYQGTGQDRGSNIGSVKPDTYSNFKLDTRGGIMKGSLGYKSVASSEMVSSGIIDISDYNIPRLYLTNTGGFTLKVLIPSMGDGQEIFLRCVGSTSTTIQNTSGTGNETTGNIEMMQGANYAMSGDDWICFHYDITDLKWHQISAGKLDLGAGASGEVFTWTANHSAAGFSLRNLTATYFNASGTDDARIIASVDGLDYVIDSITDEHDFFVGGVVGFEISSTSVNIGDNSTGASVFSVSRSSGATNFHNNSVINVGNIEIDGDVDLQAGSLLGIGSNSLLTDTSGNLEYRVASSADDHEFFVGGVAQMIIENTGMKLFNTLDTNGQNITNTGSLLFSSSGTISGSSVGWSSLAGSMYGNVQTGDSYFLRVNGTVQVDIDEDGIDIRTGWLELRERTAPVGASDRVRIYAEDNGAGKTRLMAIFPTGAAQQIAIQP